MHGLRFGRRGENVEFQVWVSFFNPHFHFHILYFCSHRASPRLTGADDKCDARFVFAEYCKPLLGGVVGDAALGDEVIASRRICAKGPEGEGFRHFSFSYKIVTRK